MITLMLWPVDKPVLLFYVLLEYKKCMTWLWYLILLLLKLVYHFYISLMDGKLLTHIIILNYWIMLKWENFSLMHIYKKISEINKWLLLTPFQEVLVKDPIFSFNTTLLVKNIMMTPLLSLKKLWKMLKK